MHSRAENDELVQLVREIAREESMKVYRQQQRRVKRMLRELHDPEVDGGEDDD